ncbi:glutamate--tRNA ligase [candidate division WOR-1 bacterium RIFOXYA12_FULL_52_29]|uniref:Glutamate--tRNA ligase n=1 Tax=candidate division WOR-1 bacterium RIFOXYC12_FULL_54_18 TaxID=1802584 RepID=A0A1F4T752_UNCSA|nr:MAG: glutamate--tRNA ligase [candidate division WOR-1 bacterium RIFOXYA2_FULL_51_19]OGC18165.1 MAG: glutamate--tRNA ligase [candidate division WOR-1 bacterium RIFOXYA12_FULL_52_29]OGC27020.1 MAG: glutamate--tRNA ligase [candidate division WOR-1 bacterium RIFOXYB2_FULL_45_9]OGC28582.1 MAG: glutamate--tRNA ligase [candidate division WOR-1 bacterium RIFOXYC12_FULL_54_18]OGC30963.1 MAG: glutamate--tRNA ligase [candidate division WOR-1 bacterium RIFOXYB12_FULL_52_16]
MVRVRFAPSPTGALHIGGARTALFNWLFARHMKGKFILRIEDTDRERSTLESNKAIFDGLEWLGLDWDEGPKVSGSFGPYFQTERVEIHRQHVQKLVDDGKAYYCFCTPEELAKKRKEAETRKEAPRYDGSCRKLPEEEIKKRLANGAPKVVRFILPAVGKTVVNDLIRGPVTFQNEVLDDFVILKSDGFPTYNFACVVDDHLMEITHVIRGDDHLSNTPRQILLYQAFGWSLPQFAHIPMILGKDKARLSKRHGATSVIEYDKIGYLPEAMINYIARLGWGHGDDEIFSRQELIEKFSLEGVGKNPAVFDLDKLNWLNGQYIRKILPERLFDLCEPLLIEAYGSHDLAYLKKIVQLFHDRLVLFPDIVALSIYFFKDDFDYDQKAAEKHFKTGLAKPVLTALKEKLAALEPFTKVEIEPLFKGIATEMNVKLGVVIHPCRLALSGRSETPPMYDVVELLGKEKVLARLDKALASL